MSGFVLPKFAVVRSPSLRKLGYNFAPLKSGLQIFAKSSISQPTTIPTALKFGV